MIAALIKKTRSFRRFYEDEKISKEVLKELIDLGRQGGSAANMQPLKYMIINTPQRSAKIFSHLKWASYLTNWPGPKKGERPSAYIVCLLDTCLSKNGDFDLGISTQNMLLAASAKGLGGCRIGAFDPEIKKIFNIPEHLKVILVLALGRPKEIVVLDNADSPDGDIKYWRDDSAVHHVPKRRLDEIIID